MRLAKPFFSGRPWPLPEPGEEEEEDERLTNRFMSAVLWKQEQAHLGSSKQVEKRRSSVCECLVTLFIPV